MVVRLRSSVLAAATATAAVALAVSADVDATGAIATAALGGGSKERGAAQHPARGPTALDEGGGEAYLTRAAQQVPARQRGAARRRGERDVAHEAASGGRRGGGGHRTWHTGLYRPR